MADAANSKVEGDAKKPDDDFWLSDPKYPEAVFKIIAFSGLSGATFKLITDATSWLPRWVLAAIATVFCVWLYSLVIRYSLTALVGPYLLHQKARGVLPTQKMFSPTVLFIVGLVSLGPAVVVVLNMTK